MSSSLPSSHASGPPLHDSRRRIVLERRRREAVVGLDGVAVITALTGQDDAITAARRLAGVAVVCVTLVAVIAGFDALLDDAVTAAGGCARVRAAVRVDSVSVVTESTLAFMMPSPQTLARQVLKQAFIFRVGVVAFFDSNLRGLVAAARRLAPFDDSVLVTVVGVVAGFLVGHTVHGQKLGTHVFEQPSLSIPLPSSQASAPSTTPLRQMGSETGSCSQGSLRGSQRRRVR